MQIYIIKGQLPNYNFYREKSITKENMRIYNKINEVVEVGINYNEILHYNNSFVQNEKIGHLLQFGPKSLNFVNKKQAIKKIMQENQLLKDKIVNAKSYVTREDLIHH